MTYVHAARSYPSAGRMADLQPILEKFTKELQSAGSDARLSVCRYGPDYPYFLLASRWATLADREKMLPTLAPITREYNAEMAAFLRQPTMTFLVELLVNVNPSTPRWVLSNELTPRVGKSVELRELFVDSVTQAGEQGRSQGLLVQVAGPETGALTRNFNFDSLADLETWRAGIARTSDFAYHRDRLLSRPLQSSIREIIVPFAT